jgi:hypothetical protein
MMYIQTIMLEPVTASIGLYLLARTPIHMDKNNRIIRRKPLYLKKKICRWIHKNHPAIIDTIIDETNDYLLDSLNIVKLINLNPSLFLVLYIFALMLIIVF